MKRHQELQLRSFRKYVSGHSRLLIFVGALIVFVTYVVKEGLRDRLRDLVTSTDAAQSVFLGERENQRISQRLAEVFRVSVLTYDNMHSPAPKPGETYPLTMSTVISHFQAASDAEDRLENQLSAVERLLKTMPKDHNRSATLDDLHEQFKAVKEADEHFRNTPYSPDKLQENLNASVGLEHEAWNTETAIQKFATVILKDSETVKKRYEIYFEIATWSSYLLYSLGWGLGLIGKLFGADGVGGDA